MYSLANHLEIQAWHWSAVMLLHASSMAWRRGTYWCWGLSYTFHLHVEKNSSVRVKKGKYGGKYTMVNCGWAWNHAWWDRTQVMPTAVQARVSSSRNATKSTALYEQTQGLCPTTPSSDIVTTMMMFAPCYLGTSMVAQWPLKFQPLLLVLAMFKLLYLQKWIYNGFHQHPGPSPSKQKDVLEKESLITVKWWGLFHKQASWNWTFLNINNDQFLYSVCIYLWLPLHHCPECAVWFL